MKNYNACISYISSRENCIGNSLKSLHDNFNYKYKYPVYVHYFDDIYSHPDLLKSAHEQIGDYIQFIKIDYNTPKHVKNEDLFFNRDLWYVHNHFSVHRTGYLHMCHFVSNMFEYPNTKFHEHDYVMVHDDEAGYNSELPYNPFEILSEREEFLGSFKSGQRLRDGKPHQGHLDTRIGLCELTVNFLKKNNITPKNKKLLNLLDSDTAESDFHFLDWCDTYVLKTSMFKTDIWKLWIKEVNESGGIYKYRWGDNEIISLFAHFVQEEIFDFKAVEEGYHDLGKYRRLQDTAPSVQDLNK